MTGTPAPRRPRRSSVRARIAVACAGLFLVLGGVLIGATYGLVSHVSAPAGGGQPMRVSRGRPEQCRRPGRQTHRTSAPPRTWPRRAKERGATSRPVPPIRPR